MKKNVIFFILTLFCIILIGCGETISGIGKDASRISKGVKTIFVTDSE